jgi:hypothetical protein
MTDEQDGILSYPTPSRKKPLPLWKHFVFVPLILWTSVFIIGCVLLFLWPIGAAIYRLFTRSP